MQYLDAFSLYFEGDLGYDAGSMVLRKGSTTLENAYRHLESLMTFDEWEQEGVVRFDEQEIRLRSLRYDSATWASMTDEELKADIKKSAKDNLYNAIRRGLQLLELKARGGELDETYFSRHVEELGLSIKNARRYMILARSPRTWRTDWPKPRSWRAVHEMVKFQPRYKTKKGEEKEEFHYTVRPDVFEAMIRPNAEGFRIVDHDTEQTQIIDYIKRHRLKRHQKGPANDEPPTPSSETRLGEVHWGDCLDLIKLIPDDSIDVVFTSPPYAMQRSEDYQSVSEKDYPRWFGDVMDALWPKLKENGSVVIIIESRVRDGKESSYVNHTIDVVCDGNPARPWNWCQRIIWDKVNAAPVGSSQRAMKTIADVVWFSKSTHPHVDLTACGTPTNRKGNVGSNKHDYGQSNGHETGIARIKDIIAINAADVDRDVPHTALMPPELARWAIRTFCPPGGTVLDPFAGAGTTLLVARQEKRQFIGIEIEKKYVELIRDRLKNDVRYRVAKTASGSA
jgi:site-specific DNA-methyltransferase (adenine-specific)